jgi:hypothetical protein
VSCRFSKARREALVHRSGRLVRAVGVRAPLWMARGPQSLCFPLADVLAQPHQSRLHVRLSKLRAQVFSLIDLFKVRPPRYSLARVRLLAHAPHHPRGQQRTFLPPCIQIAKRPWESLSIVLLLLPPPRLPHHVLGDPNRFTTTHRRRLSLAAAVLIACRCCRHGSQVRQPARRSPRTRPWPHHHLLRPSRA